MERIMPRLVWTMVILVFFLMLAAARAGYIQVVRGEHYARMALTSGTTGIALEDYSRGRILDRHGRSLTGTYTSNRVLVLPDLLEDPDYFAVWLCSMTGGDYPAVRKMLSDKRPVLLPFKLSASQLESIREPGWKGVLVVPYQFRYGPGPLAAHVTGHLGRIRDVRELEELNRLNGKNYLLSDWVGRQGLEYFYEKELKGMYPSGFAGLYVDAAGRALPGKPVMVNTDLGDFTRSDVVTTISADIQKMVERSMDRHIKKGAVVVMERSTGDLLAVASRPAYSPDPVKGGLLSAAGDERFVNQALSLFQPGSTFKVVVAAAALSEGLARPDTVFNCDGFRDKPIRCWNGAGHGGVTLAEAFAHSCNPVFAKLGMELGPEKLITYARALGLDNQGITGYPAAPDRRQDLRLMAGRYKLVNSSVGQGPVLATPLQITAMVNTVANGGVYLQPRLVMEVRPPRGAPREIRPAVPVRALSPEVSRQICDMMEMVTRQGVGRRAWANPGGTAGKTGSAQPVEGADRVNAWFSGYGPLDGPGYIVTVLVREGVSGGETAAPVFREIMEGIFSLQSSAPPGAAPSKK